MKRGFILAIAVSAAACEGPQPMPVDFLEAQLTAGDGQTVTVGTAAVLELTLSFHSDGSPAADIPVTWQAATGGSVVPAVDTTDAGGKVTTTYTAAGLAGQQLVRASFQGQPPATFTVTAVAAAASAVVRQSGNGQSGIQGSPLPLPLQALVTDAFGNPLSGVTVSWALTQGTGALSAASTTTNAAGLASVTLTPSSTGPLTVSASIGGAAPVSFSATGTLAAVLLSEIPFSGYYHDQYVRDGIAFLSAWGDGLRIYDIGGGGRGGSPAAPVLIGGIVTATNGVPGGTQVHNAWWYHSPAGQKRYVFVGQEGPGQVPLSSAGDIHVVDVTNMAAPVEVASYRLPGAGVHNFWVDEQNEILYAAFYNGGVVALDIAGTLSGDLASREIARIQPGGAGNTFVWGVHLAGTSLYATDMRSGFWQLQLSGNTFQVLGGGNNVPERWGSDQWVHGGYAYSGTWGTRSGVRGNALKVWQLSPAGVPALVDSIVVAGVGTISDVEVSADGKLLMFSAENATNAAGIYFYDLTVSRTQPRFIGRYATSNNGVHTTTFAEIGGRRYVVAARNAPTAAIFLDVTAIGP